ncbi:hypothetical protein K443DRAFT_110006 [Laccaria amethystina LaAM-08-1]|uniref:Uncharacterized protein n=1 Tax=Laccaria amethystina LaAM-08-1 TaxID=1095629 RepID=A0A0C9XAF3_9AGAR|nr:hypothetical protein K443DRAFT_110006 [Laccaria amethystina LaAM-08-1]
MFVPCHSTSYSKPLPLTPSFPLPPTFPPAGKRQSKRSFILNCRPPPIPTLVRSLSTSSSILSSPSNEINASRHPSSSPQPLSTPVHHAPQPRPHLADPLHTWASLQTASSKWMTSPLCSRSPFTRMTWT